MSINSPFSPHTGLRVISILFPFIFGVVFVFIISMMIAAAVRGGKRYRRNEASPVLTVMARVMSRRENSRRMGSGMDHSHASTDYYVTFEVESGDRMELPMSGQEYGLLAEGDRGKLTFQGTRYKGFERSRF